MELEKHIEGLKKGSYNDFKVLYEMFSGNLYGFVYGLTRSRTTAEEIVQETFMRVWINRAGLDPRTSFRSYLFTVARNLSIDSFRRQLRNPVFGEYLEHCDTAREAGNDIEANIDFDIFNKKLAVAKNRLTPRQREIFELAKERGIAPSEIARLSGVSEQTVYNQLSQALKTLKKELNTLGAMVIILFN